MIVRPVMTLLGVQLAGIYNLNKITHPKDKKEQRNTLIMSAVLVLTGFIMCGYVAAAAYGYAMIGLAKLIPQLMMTMASVFTMFAAFFKCRGLLFGFTDYDMIMSLPVNVSDVVISRFAVMYIFELPFVAGIMVPSGVIYCIFVQPPAIFYIYFIVSLFFIPLIPVILAVVLGIIITFISVRIKYRNMVSTVMSLMIIIGILLLSFGSSSVNGAAVTSFSIALSEKLNSVYMPSRLYSSFITEQNLLAFVYFTATSAGLFAAFIWLFSPFYPKLSTLLTAQQTHQTYKKEEIRALTPSKALYIRELRRYLTTPAYVINTSVGVIMMLIASAALLFIKPSASDAMIFSLLARAAPFVMCTMTGLSNTTASSLSLEGKSLWIVTSSPVSAETLYRSKIAVNLTVTVPAIMICALLIRIKVPMNAAETVLLFICPLVFAFMSAVVGIALNLQFLNLDWTAEVFVVKQSAPVVFATLGGMMLGILPAVASIALTKSVGGWIITAAYTVICAAVLIAVYNTIRKTEIKT